ncbi:peptidylprolyl isomerase [Mangrovivirga cuniculi]|uniref:Peptidylprolyl isomerase n=1 Tax=Mangrovivirga cuniculi TaxID=2715131 RepID=A0A4D7JLM6_9BACT|nr:peptidylprolyl isomerase [Mangrovivirga cuniculi]QCK13462.1 peptidylprolyl isomerase [Mangrovivirga cuniculi]
MKILKYLDSKVSFVVALFFLCINVNAQDNEEVITADGIIAKVDDYIVLKSDLEKAYLDFLSRGNYGGQETKCRILQQQVIGKLMLAKAEIDSVIVSDEDVTANLDRRVASIIQSVGGNEAQLEQLYGRSLESIKNELKDQIREQMTIQRMQQEITANVSVTPREVQQFYKSISDSLPFISTQVTAGQIVKYPEINKEEKQRVIDFLNDLKRQIESGQLSFADAAMKYSQDPGSAAKGGEYGWTKRGNFVPEYEGTVYSIEKGEISDPVESDFGFHLIQLLDRRGNEYRSRHILIAPKITSADVEDAKNYLDSMRTLILQDSLSFEEAAKEYSDDKYTADAGGYFTDQSGVPRVLAEEMDANIYFAIDTMEVGDISKPLTFTVSSPGTVMHQQDAARIIYYKERFQPHEANLTDDFERIKRAALIKKQGKKEEEWFLDARDEVYIAIDPEYKECKIMQ